MPSKKRTAAALTALYFFLFIIFCPLTAGAKITRHQAEDKALVVKEIPQPATEENNKSINKSPQPVVQKKTKEKGWFSRNKWWLLAGLLAAGGAAAAGGGGGGGSSTDTTGSATVHW